MTRFAWSVVWQGVFLQARPPNTTGYGYLITDGWHVSCQGTL